MALSKRGLESKLWWATVRGPQKLPVLWASRSDARAQRDPDEYVVRVLVMRIGPVRRQKAQR